MVQSLKRAGLMLMAPAKLNLTLEVMGKRNDGFHQIRSVLQTIELWDSIYMELMPSGIDFHCSQPNLGNHQNLVWRAAESLMTAQASKGISIRLQKGIPEAAGLGGGSSDSATTLKGLDFLWGSDLGQEKLVFMASKLSSDAPFFLVGGTALAEGRGEIITALPPLLPHWAVILKPDIRIPHSKTAYLYNKLAPEHYTQGEHTARLVDALAQGGATVNIQEQLFNVFEAMAFKVYPELSKHRDFFVSAGAPAVHLAGSGPALFSLATDEEKSARIYNNLKKKKLEVYLARTGN